MNKRMITGSQALKDAGKIIAYMMIGDKFSEKEVQDVKEILTRAQTAVKNDDGIVGENIEVQLPNIIE